MTDCRTDQPYGYDSTGHAYVKDVKNDHQISSQAAGEKEEEEKVVRRAIFGL